MGNASNISNSGWRSTLKRAARVVAIVALSAPALMAVSVFILWDADNFAMRLRLESLKFAWFGDWVKESDLLPRDTQAEDLQSVSDDLNGAMDFTFFREAEVEGTDVVVITGTLFGTSEAILNGTPQDQWCYIGYGVGEVTKRLDLATKEGNATPSYADLSALSQSDLSELGLTASRLQSLAQTHCKFDLSGSRENNNQGEF